MPLELSQLKNVIGVIAIVLTFAGYVPYIRDILKGKTHPHLYSWFLWSLIGGVAFSLQFLGGGGLGTFVTLAAVSMCVLVFLLSFFRKSSRDITKTDTLFFVLTFIALFIWLVAKQPVLSAILITFVDLLGFVPTIRKSWNKPHSETVSFYSINTLRFFLATISLQKYTIVTAFYPSVWLLTNALFALMLLTRRQKILK